MLCFLLIALNPPDTYSSYFNSPRTLSFCPPPFKSLALLHSFPAPRIQEKYSRKTKNQELQDFQEMEDYNNYNNYYPRKQCVPAFGSWEWSNEVAVPFTQCFESATQAGQLLRYSYSQDRDLYVAGDLYDHDLITPAMIVVPRRRGKVRQGRVKEEKEEESWGNKVKETASPIGVMPRQTPKPVDEDLYKIPPELLYAKSKKKRGMGFFFTSCLLPTCVM